MVQASFSRSLGNGGGPSSPAVQTLGAGEWITAMSAGVSRYTIKSRSYPRSLTGELLGSGLRFGLVNVCENFDALIAGEKFPASTKSDGFLHA